MIVDNFKEFEAFFDKLKSEDDFYSIQIIHRKKDGTELPSYTSNARTIKSFYFYNKVDFLKQEPYIKDLCKNNNAQAYFWVNPRNSFDVACEAIKQYIELIQGGNTKQGASVYNRAAGLARSNKYDKLWITDLDNLDSKYIQKITNLINNCRGKEDNKIKYYIPTVNGVHLLTSGFDENQFKQLLALYQLDNIDIHKDGPSLLYYNYVKNLNILGHL